MIEDAHCIPVTCTVCGEPGVGTIETSGASWIKGNVIEHRDPKVCANNLKRKLDKANKSLEEARTYTKSCADTMEMVEKALKKAREDN